MLVELSRKSGTREEIGVFLEDQLLQSMMHNVLEGSYKPIGGYDPLVDMVSLFLSIPSVNPKQGRTEDDLNPFGPGLQAHISYKVFSTGVECGELVSNGLECPPRFKIFLAKVRLLSRVEEVSETDDRHAGGSNLDKVASADLNHGVPSCSNSFSVEEVP